MSGHLLASYPVFGYGVGLLLILSHRYSRTCLSKISFQHHAFFVCIYHYWGAGSKQFELLMKTDYIHEYTSPKLEVIEVEIEQGFSISNMESIEDDKPEQDW